MKATETRDLTSVSNILNDAARGYPRDRIISILATPNAQVPVAVLKQLTPLTAHISSSGAYVLVGALGGVGEMIADLLVRGGAKTLVFLSRRGTESPKAEDLCKDFQQRGVRVIIHAVDVTDLSALKSVWESVTQQVSVLGVVQCAAVFKVCKLPTF